MKLRMIERVEFHRDPVSFRSAALAALATLIGMASSGAQAVELVQNGGFETGSFSGWTTSPTGSDIDPLVFGVDIAGPKNGQYSAYFGDVNQVYDAISQNLATTAGAHYTLSFYLDASLTQGAPASFIGSFGGVTFLDISDLQPDFDFKPFTFDVMATGSSTVLTFAGYNTNAFYTLDDVSVTTPVPELPTWALMAMALAAGATWRRVTKRIN